MEIYLIIKSGRMSGILVSGKTFPSSKYYLTTSMTFKIPNTTWAVGRSFNLYVGLAGPRWLYVRGIPPGGDVRLWTPGARGTDLGQSPNLRAGSERAPCVPQPRARGKTRGRKRKTWRRPRNTAIYMHTGPLEHVGRTSTRAQTCVRGLSGLPACHRAYSTRKDPRLEEKNMPKGPVTLSCIFIQGSPSGCVRSEILGVTHVEKRHEGNTEVVTGCICWMKHGMHLSWGINSY